ncbi:sensor histidine kinase [Olivibacter sp. CPCC 100613]|uniref:sensor histidine kinase n=1 Tax=Olivibacter sp. CPCC 100613 TaxID=3079931 RepID=UPI002FFCB665
MKGKGPSNNKPSISKWRETIENAVRQLRIDPLELRKTGIDHFFHELQAYLTALEAENEKLHRVIEQLEEEKIRFAATKEHMDLALEAQKYVTAATLRAEENERRRISEWLHDSVSQLLYAINVKVDRLHNENGKQEAIRSIQKLLTQAIRETRNISFELAPSILADFGLPTTLEDLASRLSSTETQIDSQIIGFDERLDLRLESSVFRIVQELVNNCMKHATANKVRISVKKSHSIEITVRDNGKGFNIADPVIFSKGTGLSSIRNRISLYDGTLHIDSKPGLGTTVRIFLSP